MISVLDNSIEFARARLSNSGVAQFLRWWMHEMGDLLPARVKAELSHVRRRVIFQVRPAELLVSLSGEHGLQQLEATPFLADSELQQQQLRDLLSERELDESPRDLLLEESQVLRKIVVLPLAAETNLRQALSYEMDRQTPFAANDVHFDYQVMSRDKDLGLLRVQLFVVPRKSLEQQLSKLQAVGISLGGVDVLLNDQPAGVNLLPPALRSRVANRKVRFNFLAGTVLLLLLMFTMMFSLWLRQHQVQEVQSAIEKVRTDAMQVQAIRERIEDAGKAAGFLNERRNASVPIVILLNEVTRLLPDDTYLDRLLIDSSSVQLQGKSTNAQQLIELVNQSELLTDASFRGPTRLDSRTQKELFDITATVNVSGSN